jgi:septum formation protein
MHEIHPIIQPVRLVLASRSPRRAELLRAAGFGFDVLAVDVDERLRAGESPAEYVRRLAAEKSARALDGLRGRSSRQGAPDVADGADTVVVLGADTAVVVDACVLGKPADDAEAAAMLRKLAGRTHEVLTGISLRTGSRELGHVTSTTVEVAALTEDEIRWYVGSGEGRDKAGGYAIQGLAARFVPRISGSYANVVGLPVAAVHALLAEIAS